jgi:hypothetical protein
MQSIMRRSAAVVATAVATLAGLTTAGIAPAQPVAHAARSCGLGGEWAKLGPTYVEPPVIVTGTNCATGIKVIKAYNRCRLNAGGVKGRCHAKVLGYRCTEQRSTSPVQFVASVRCTARRKVVKFSYSENT